MSQLLQDKCSFVLICKVLQKYGLETSESGSSQSNMEWESSENGCNNSSQEDSSTITLTCPSQLLILSQQEEPLNFPHVETKEESRQTEHNMSTSVILGVADYQNLVRDASKTFNLKDDITKIRVKCAELCGEDGNPEMDPSRFERMSIDAEAENVFPYIYNALCPEKMSENHRILNKNMHHSNHLCDGPWTFTKVLLVSSSFLKNIVPIWN